LKERILTKYFFDRRNFFVEKFLAKGIFDGRIFWRKEFDKNGKDFLLEKF
jgi:hypothetical protein